VWDGNEVWLVIVGGALFAGFPTVYATLFSGFYDLCMILLAGLIFRAVAIEFRSKRESKRWRSLWDCVFAGASYVISFGLGIVFGNLFLGIPLNAAHDFTGDFSLFLRPFPLFMGLFTTSLMMMHGALFLSMKTEGSLHNKLRLFTRRCMGLFIALFLVATVWAWLFTPHMVDRFKEVPLCLLVPLAACASIAAGARLFARGLEGWAFICSASSIALLFLVFGIGTFPYLVRSTVQTDTYSLTFLNASSSQLTLKVLLIIVAIGVPLVLAYGSFVYRIFRGKVRLDKHSY
jgi:cytochrome d ubiquinol oxidase subunit II